MHFGIRHFLFGIRYLCCSQNFLCLNSCILCISKRLHMEPSPIVLDTEKAIQAKPHFNFWQIWNMCFGFFGIQFGWSLQMNNMSAIYEYLGATPQQIPGLWLAAP